MAALNLVKQPTLKYFVDDQYIYISILQHDTLGSKKIRKTGAKNPTVGGKLGAEITQYSFDSLFVSNNRSIQVFNFPLYDVGSRWFRSFPGSSR